MRTGQFLKQGEGARMTKHGILKVGSDVNLVPVKIIAEMLCSGVGVRITAYGSGS